jgi:hypothetical protein
VVVRRSFHDRYGFYDPSYKICMDAALFIRAIRDGAAMESVHGPVAYIEPGGISSNIAARIRELQRILSRHYRQPIPFLLAFKWYVASRVASIKCARLK